MKRRKRRHVHVLFQGDHKIENFCQEDAMDHAGKNTEDTPVSDHEMTFPFNGVSDDISPEDEIAFRLARKLPPHQFSEGYEAKWRDSLISKLGEENADIVLKAREDVKKQASETAADIFPDDSKFSPAVLHEKKKTKHKHSLQAPTLSQLQKAAVACLVLFLAGAGTMTMSAEALRMPVLHFSSQSERTYNIIKTETETDVEETFSDAIKHIYVLGKTADGYEEIARETYEKSNTIIYQYKKDSRQQYIFAQFTGDAMNWVNEEDVYMEKCKVVSGGAFYYESDDIFNLIWSFDNYVFKISGDFTKEEMIELANSLILER